MKYYLSLLVVNLISYQSINGQACCTAGTPLLGSLEMSSPQKCFLQFALTANHNSLKDVLSGTNFIEDQERERVSQSVLFEVNYGLFDNVSLTTLFTFNRQSRTITNNKSSIDELNVSGLGDAMLMLKYNLISSNIFNRQDLAIGSGLKFPIGSSNLTSNGILLPADMQPGTGSWDFVLWGIYSKGEFVLPDLSFIANLSYRINGANNRFGNNNAGYRFGNELLGTMGLSYNFNSYFELSFLSQFRHTSQDEFDNSTIPNTGGTWNYIISGLNFHLDKNISFRLSGDLPVYRNVSGTQLTTTFKTSLSFYYTINLMQGNF